VKRRGLASVGLAALLLLTGAYFGLCLFIATRLSAPTPQPMEATPGEFGLEYREVTVESEDGLELSAWWAPGDPGVAPQQAAVLVHGWGGNKSEEHVLETASLYADAGYAVLMLDLRGHGESEGKRRTLAYQEVRDVRGALGWLQERGFAGEDVVLHGWSMGAATVVRSAPGTGVAAVVEEAGFADLPLLLRDELPETSGLPRLFNGGTFLMGKLFLDFDPWAVRPREEAARLREEGVPLFVIHSRDDETVPIEHAALFREAYPEAAYWELAGVEHVQAYREPDYEGRLRGFLNTAVPSDNRSRATASAAGSGSP
jgi:pimeloyl-ACP methyl ester carboxylesterase